MDNHLIQLPKGQKTDFRLEILNTAKYLGPTLAVSTLSDIRITLLNRRILGYWAFELAIQMAQHKLRSPFHFRSLQVFMSLPFNIA